MDAYAAWSKEQIQACPDICIRIRDKSLPAGFYTTTKTALNEVLLDFSRSKKTRNARLADATRSFNLDYNLPIRLLDQHVLGDSAVAARNGKPFRLSKDHQWLYCLQNGGPEGPKIPIGQQGCPGRRKKTSITSHGTKIFLSGGRPRGGFLSGGWSRYGEELNDVWTLDTASRTPSWTLLSPTPSSPLPPGRSGHSSVTDGKMIYIFGGMAGGELCNDTWGFDISAMLWKNLSCIGDIPNARELHSCVLMDNVVYVFGGRSTGGGILRDLLALRLSEHRWIRLRNFQDSVIDTTKSSLIAAFGSKLYVLSGWHPVKNKPNVLENDIHILDTRFATDPVSGQGIHSWSSQRLSSSSPPLSLTTEDVPFVDRNDNLPVTEGGFAELFRGRHRPSGLVLAMKRPKLVGPGDHADTIRRLRREAKFWSSFNHPNILPFLCVMETPSSLYLVSPWMEQGDLSDFLVKHGEYVKRRKTSRSVLPGDSFLASFDEGKTIHGLASGIQYLHSLGCIHGDIKAKNVLLDHDGNALLGDFGLSKTSGDATSVAVRGTGTLRWQAPELLEEGTKTRATDVYAFAMTIVEILTGGVPFPGMKNTQILTAVCIRKRRPQAIPLSREDRDFRLLWSLASDCWQEKPGDRPSMNNVISRFTKPSRAQPAPDPNTIPNIVALFSFCRRIARGPLPHFGREEVLSTNPPLWINCNSRRYALDQDVSYRDCWEGWNHLSKSVLQSLTSLS